MRVVMTNGCFDLLGPHHIRFLGECAALGDYLVVAVNSDESVKHLKGRLPIRTQEERAYMLKCLRFVDDTVIFHSEGELTSLIHRIGPDVLAKGAEYSGRKVTGSEYAKSVQFITMIPGHSTTKTMERIRQCQPAS